MTSIEVHSGHSVALKDGVNINPYKQELQQKRKEKRKERLTYILVDIFQYSIFKAPNMDHYGSNQHETITSSLSFLLRSILA